MMHSKDITRIAGKYEFGLELIELLMADSRNRPTWFVKTHVTGILDVLESPEVLDGTGKKVNDLYNRMITEYNARARQTNDSEIKLSRGSSDAQILKVRYRNIDETVGPLEFEFGYEIDNEKVEEIIQKLESNDIKKSSKKHVIWECEYCNKEFKTKKETEKHEMKCGQKNKESWFKNFKEDLNNLKS